MPELKVVPQVKGDFLLGNLRQYKANSFQAIRDWQQHYGDIVSFKLANRQLYLFSHPTLIEDALIKQSDTFIKMYQPEKPTGLALVLGQGLVTSQGDLWHRQRRLMQPVFQRSKLNTMHEQMVITGNNMLDRWKQLGNGADINLSDEMTRLALEVITQTMFSTSVLDQVQQISPALETGLKYAAKSMANPLTPPLYIPTTGNRKFKQALSLLDDVIYGIVQQRKAQTERQQDLLDMLMHAQDQVTAEKMSDQQIRDEIITIFTAGHETTANLLSWTLYLLAKHPQILIKLKQELQHELKGHTADTESLKRLQYSRAVLNESMRIRPPVGIMMRKVSRNTTVNGYAIKAGSLAVFSIYNVHHHPDFWPDPEQFSPERFLINQKRRFSFLPFGTGERICIGNHFATMESQLLLSMIIQSYDIQLINDSAAEIEMSVTIRPKGGIAAKIFRRRFENL